MTNAENGGDGRRAGSITDDLRDEIKAVAVKQAATYTIAAVVALLAIAAIGWLLYLKEKVIVLVHGVPPGAIMAFDLNDSCPDGWGWTKFDAAQGRFIVGSGENDGTAKRAFRVAGGSDTHKLTKDELPPIPFTFNSIFFNGDHWMPGGGGDVASFRSTTVDLGSASKAIDLLPPYLPLRYCRKD